LPNRQENLFNLECGLSTLGAQQTLLIKEPIMKINKFNRVLLLFVLVFITTAGTLLAGELMDKVYRNDIEAVKKYWLSVLILMSGMKI